MVRSHFSKFASLFAVALAATAFPGCYAIIHADTPSDHCGFSGAETACGTCLRKECQTEIDKCCGDKDCLKGDYSSDKPFMEALDLCASGDPAVCATITSSKEYAYVTQAKILASCLTDKCLSACAGTSAPHRSCKDTDPHKCDCTNDTEKQGVACSLASVGGGDAAICVNWSGGCRCALMACTGGSTYCTCSNTGESGGFTGCNGDPASKYSHCCVKVDASSGTVQCRCDELSCSTGDAEVSACTDEAFRAALKNRIVDHCDN